MTHLFIVCHEGELPYVIHDLRDVLHGDSTVQIVSQGSTKKMYMGYVLLESKGDIPISLLRELRANPDVYLYAIPDPEAQDEDTEEGDQEEREEAAEPVRRNPSSALE